MIELISLPSTVQGWLVYLIGLLLLWIIISLPVYFAAKVLTGGRADFLDAMGATLGGVIIYFLVYYIVELFLGPVASVRASFFATVLAVLSWLAVYRVAFRTTWVRGIGIVVISFLMLLVIDFILVNLFGFTFPSFFPFGV